MLAERPHVGCASRKSGCSGSQSYARDPGAVAEQMIGMVSLRRYGSAREVVAFLLADDASYVTGVNLEVSGGSA